MESLSSDAPFFAEMVAASNFSFLTGASHPEELVLRALALGLQGMGIADRNTLAGVVRAHSALMEIRESDDGTSEGAALAARAGAFRLVVGARLVFADGAPDVVVYPENRTGWARLCRLLTDGNRKAAKGECHLVLDDLLADMADLCLILMPPHRLTGIEEPLRRLADAAPGRLWLGATMARRGDDRRRLQRLEALARPLGVPLLATGDVLYAAPAERDLQDVLSCIREKTTIFAAGRLLEANGERHLKAPGEMARLFADVPEAVGETHRLLQRIGFSLTQLKYEYPDEPVPPGWEAQAWLEDLTWRCAEKRYPEGVSQKVRGLLEGELKLIAELSYAPYFLTIYDIVSFAKERGILHQGRGSAANSAVCYVLGITAVDPMEHDLLFARFISAERQEPPDIDVDFEHERREEVIQHIYEKYGRHRAGIVATVIRYRPRSAIREVGKALGLTEDVTARLSSTQWGSWGSDITRRQIEATGLDPDNPEIARAVRFAVRLLDFPRHLSQHVGGFVLARGRLDELVPIGNAAMADRTFIEWDKDDIDALGLMKVDVLALGMLTCIRKAFELLERHEGIVHDLASVPKEEKPVYDMLCRGDSLGVFQVESRAQMNMLPRLKPEKFYDLVIEVAIVRPGPIQGDMVHPYLRRRAGLEPVEFPSPSPDHGPANELVSVLGKTMGVPLFQEQAMKLAMVAAKFSDIEANKLRRAMATFRNVGTIGSFEELMVGRMVARGYDEGFARRCFEQIKGFGSYGFPESHAASFAKLVYVSSWIKCVHPAVFACALLNSQPMGFYAPAQIVRDAESHGVRVLPVDVDRSFWDNGLERDGNGRLCLRLGFRQIDGFSQDDGESIAAARQMMDAATSSHFDIERPYASIEDLAARTGLLRRPLRLLADADAFSSMRVSRREALWAIRRLPGGEALPLFAAADARELGEEAGERLPVMMRSEEVGADYQTVRLSLKGHPMEFLRPVFAAERVSTSAEIAAARDGAWKKVAGVVLVRQRPGNGKAIFITIEDETGVTNIVLWSSTFERFRSAVMGARLLLVEGKVQKSPEGIVHLMAMRLTDRTGDLKRLSESHEPKITLSGADEFLHPQMRRHPRNVRVLPKSRDFH
ncbi:error-prone DNA polymerase [Consotaella salsifontis]|uniref:Error-prone DNA polymerase n=1 Tax=Consotaella salsifontis TaxID=1365950 RepID=A0A1T4SML9_9HYPH|nr:error-prone DNA polymerase [Consotaella salsifontis]SKA29530.1 error-prone DNA polymerase, DnaE-like [Consotaella salsifontis]